MGGGISVYIPPKSVTVLFTCGTLTHVLKLQWLVKTYTPPRQIKFLATPLLTCHWHIVLGCVFVHVLSSYSSMNPTNTEKYKDCLRDVRVKSDVYVYNSVCRWAVTIKSWPWALTFTCKFLTFAPCPRLVPQGLVTNSLRLPPESKHVDSSTLSCILLT